MRKLLFILLVAAATAASYALHRPQSKVKTMTDAELMHHIDSCIENDIPLSAEPFFTEAKRRASLIKDTRQMLNLIDKEMALNSPRLETTEAVGKAIDKEMEGAWTPLREMLWLRKANFTHKMTEKDVKTDIIDKADQLRAISAYSVTDSANILIPMSAYDYIMLTIKDLYIIRDNDFAQTVSNSWRDNGDATSKILYEASQLSTFTSHDKALHSVATIDSLAFSPETHALSDLAWGVLYEMRATEAKKSPDISNALADTAISHYNAVAPAFKVMNGIAKRHIEFINGKKIDVQTENKIIPDKYVPLFIETKNIAKVSVSIYENTDNFDFDKNSPVKTYDIDIPAYSGRIASQTTYTELEGLPVGNYIISVSQDSLRDYTSVQSSNISLADIHFTGGDYLSVINATNGLPLLTAKVNGRSTDDYGMVDITSKIKSYNDRKYTIVNGNDKVEHEIYTYRRDNPSTGAQTHLNMLTDRNIYRPGQTVYFKIWSYKANTETMWADTTHKPIEVTFKSHNGTKLASAKFSVNRMGTASGQFVIPEDVDLGMATLIADNWNCTRSIRIEEYKRSGNKLTFDPIREAYLYGDSITIRGKATSADDKPIADAVIVVNDSTNITTDDKGRFEYTYLDSGHNEETVVHFKMTDRGGETTEGDKIVSLTDEGNHLDIDVKDQLTKTENGSFSILSYNSNDQPYKADVTYVVERLKHQHDYLPTFSLLADTIVGQYSLDIRRSNEKFIVIDTIMQQTVTVDSLLSLPIDVANLPTGLYRIKAKAQSHYAKRNATSQEVSETAQFSIINLNGSNDLNTVLFLQSYDKFTPGKPATFYIGTRIKDANILVVAEFAGKIIHRQFVSCSEEIKAITVDVPTSKHNYTTLNVSAILVNSNRFNTQNITIQKADDEDTNLHLELETWHDKSSPAAEETATLVIKADTTAATEILASMYDARLDRICRNSWHNRYFYKHNLTSYLYPSTLNPSRPWVRFRKNAVIGNGGRVVGTQNGFHEISSILASSDISNTYDSYNLLYSGSHGEMVVVGYGASKKRGGARLLKAMAANVMDSDAMVVEEESMAMAEDVSAVLQSIVPGISTQKSNRVVIRGYSSSPEPAEAEAESDETEDAAEEMDFRTDFRETVFFLPELTTDATGRATFSFTIPDNITTYNFRAIAHQKNMHSGYVTSTMAVTKPLTVKAWVPRTLTEGDTINVGMAISTDLPLDSLRTRLATTGISALGSSTAEVIDIDKTHWSVIVPSGIDSLQISFSATSGKFTDGERHTLPVRRRCQEITESQSFMLMTMGTFLTDNPFADSTAISQKVTFNYTSNTWSEVLRSLPHLYNCPYPSSDNYLGQIESSAIAMTLMQRDDVKQWVNDLKSADSASVLTPHHIDRFSPWNSYNNFLANHDREVIKMLSGNNSQKTYEKALRNLKKMQLSDGSFPWFKGMSSSDFITRHILSTLGLMARFGMVNATDVNDICKKGQTYIEHNITKEVKEWERQKIKDPTPSYTMLHELYTLTCLSGIDMKNEYIAKAVNAIPKASRLKEPSQKLMASLIYNRISRKDDAKLLLKSITENLVRPDEYSAHISLAGRFWYTNTTFVHSMLIMSMNELNPGDEDLYRVINWLMKEKHSTHWNDTQATSRAVLALLTQQADNRHVDTIKVYAAKADDLSTPSETTPVSTQLHLDANAIDKVGIAHTDKMPAWGNWQRVALMPTDKMDAHGTDDISVRRNVEIMTSDDTARDKQPISMDKVSLKVGDRVRITVTVTTSVDMDFVRISDFRPAAFEPVDQTSGYRGWWWLHRIIDPTTVCHYFSPNDESVDFFIERLPRGTHSFSYECYVTNAGQMNAGYAEAVCLYTDGLNAHTEGSRITLP